MAHDLGVGEVKVNLIQTLAPEEFPGNGRHVLGIILDQFQKAVTAVPVVLQKLTHPV